MVFVFTDQTLGPNKHLIVPNPFGKGQEGTSGVFSSPAAHSPDGWAVRCSCKIPHLQIVTIRLSIHPEHIISENAQVYSSKLAGF